MKKKNVEVPKNCRECKNDAKCITYYGSIECEKKRKVRKKCCMMILKLKSKKQ